MTNFVHCKNMFHSPCNLLHLPQVTIPAPGGQLKKKRCSDVVWQCMTQGIRDISTVNFHFNQVEPCTPAFASRRAELHRLSLKPSPSPQSPPGRIPDTRKRMQKHVNTWWPVSFSYRSQQTRNVHYRASLHIQLFDMHSVQ